MASYRHGFHAGNHADVLKHLVEVLTLDHLLRQPEGFLYVDTHAGAGLYDLENTLAQRNAEFIGGIDALRHTGHNLPPELRLYVNIVDDCCQKYREQFSHCYPGSPLIAMQMLREIDHVTLFETLDEDADTLSLLLSPHAKLARADGFAGLKAIQPPKSRRGLALIDPCYEDKEDYQRVVEAVKTALKQFDTGVFAVWYPLLPQADHQAMVRDLLALSPEYYLRAELEIHPPRGDYGMYGSGVFVINPPWKLHQQLKVAMPALHNLLAKDDGCQRLEYRQP